VPESALRALHPNAVSAGHWRSTPPARGSVGRPELSPVGIPATDRLL